MQKLRNTFDNLWAALIFFTRLPFWRLHEPPQQSYSAVVEWWPLTGWITAGFMAAILYATSHILPYSVAVVVAITSRILITGALHEDGLADFFDGFGGGRGNRERILAIMKDSHIGTYGVIALIIYFMMLWTILMSMQPINAALAILMADPFAKMISAQMIQMLPYARTAETAKNQTVYRRFNITSGILLTLQGLIPLGIFIYANLQLFGTYPRLTAIIVIPALVMYAMYIFLRHSIKGYTGDCCGAAFLLTELSIYIVLS